MDGMQLIEAFLDGRATLNDLRLAVDQTSKIRTIVDIEKDAIELAILRNGGNKREAAEELGVSLKTIYNKIQLWNK